METTFHLLRILGLRSNYSGYNYLAYAVTLVLENPDYLKNITRNLYRIIGEKYGVTNLCVEAAIRNMITSYWNQNDNKIIAPILGYPLFDKPTSSELIAILSDFLRDHPDFGV